MLNRITTALFLLLASSHLVSAQSTAQGDADAKEVAAYRLTTDNLNRAVAATRAMVEELKKDPKFQQLARLGAELDALEKAIDAKDDPTDAEIEKLETLKQQYETLEESMAAGISMGDSDTLSDMERNIANFPLLAKSLRSAGMTPREYAKFTMAMLTSAMAAGMKKAGLLKELPKELSAENVEFVLKHEAELAALQKEWQALNPRR
jgi:hypothetical protein